MYILAKITITLTFIKTLGYRFHGSRTILILNLKNTPYAKGTIEFNPFLCIRHVHGDLCKHLGIDSSTDLEGSSVFDFKVLEFGLGYIFFTLSMRESSSGLIASEICNSWIVKLVMRKNRKKDVTHILAPFAGPHFHTAGRMEYVGWHL